MSYSAHEGSRWKGLGSCVWAALSPLPATLYREPPFLFVVFDTRTRMTLFAAKVETV